MMDFLSVTKIPALIRPTRSIGGVICDVTLEENHEDGLTITEYPVENGANISDHATIKPKRVSIRVAASDAGGSLLEDSGENRSIEIYQKLLDLMEAREPFEVITAKRSYKNMLIESISAPTDSQSQNALIAAIECREVITATVETTSVPPRARHQNGAKTGGVADKGAKSAQPAGASSLQSGIGSEGSGYRRPGGPAS